MFRFKTIKYFVRSIYQHVILINKKKKNTTCAVYNLQMKF